MAGYPKVRIVKEGDHKFRIGSVWYVCPDGKWAKPGHLPVMDTIGGLFEIFDSAPKECCEPVEDD
jgi:hypothetical protein